MSLPLVNQAQAQVFTSLHNFTQGTNSSSVIINADGARPSAGLVLSSNTLFGTTSSGGCFGSGTVFAMKMDGTGFTNLHSFAALTLDMLHPIGGISSSNSDGAVPNGGLALSGNTLYGTTSTGGPGGQGTLFAINTDGSGFTNLHDFISYDGANPNAGLILSGNTLYGTTSSGGAYQDGTIFAINTDGSNFRNIYFFSSVPQIPPMINGDGAKPMASLVLSSNILYGTAAGGGIFAKGTVFSIGTDGSDFKNLHNFDGEDGDGPEAGLIVSGNTLYGTTCYDTTFYSGTVFRVNTDGSNFKSLNVFTGGVIVIGVNNMDGAMPKANLILSGNTLYGTTLAGDGTLFSINTDGTDYKIIYGFTNAGSNPEGGLIMSNNTFYGVTASGGTSIRYSSGNGTIFKLVFAPRLTIVPAGNNVIVTWPTYYAGFDYTKLTLQSAPTLGPAAIWSTNLPSPIISNDQNVVALPISETQQYYRLINNLGF